MGITTEIKRGVLVIKFEGELDLHLVSKIRDSIDKIIDDQGIVKVIINLHKVSFLDSSGLGLILGRYKKLNSLGGNLSLSQASPQVIKILQAAGVLNIVNLYANDNEALEHV